MSDGLLLNLSLDLGSAVVSTAVSKPTGGRWKDRRKARNASKYAARAHSSTAVPDDSSSYMKIGDKKRKVGHSEKHVVKRAKAGVSTGAHHGSHSASNRTNGSDHPKETTDTFVSSLFTSNPVVEKSTISEKVTTGEATNAPLKDTSFSNLGISKSLVSYLQDKMSMSRPTLIQKSVIPKMIEHDVDIFAKAQTGTGKTLAYVLPILERIARAKNIDRTAGLFALILAPTRELSTQIYSVLEGLARACHWIVPGIVTGGEKRKSEKARIRRGINILVATPGRLVDHFENTEALDLSQVRWIVLDEGDRLMELGFEETITKILNLVSAKSRINETAHHFLSLPQRRVNILCSATIKHGVKKLGELSLSNAEFITSDSVKSNVQSYTAPAQLLQRVSVVPAKLRLVTLAAKLMTVVREKPMSRIMVFFSCTDSLDFYFSAFTRNGKSHAKKKNDDGDDDYDDTETARTVVSCPLISDKGFIYKLHGSLNQHSRTSTLAAFSKRKTGDGPSILFCTDVASRGLDLPEVSDVIEYDPPFAIEDHLHRIGRTARAGHAGSSLLFLLPGKEEGYLELMKASHLNGIQTVGYENLLKDAFGAQWDVTATTWHLEVERWLLENEAALSLARRGFISHIRAYTTHLSKEREIFNMKSLHLGHIAKSFALREIPGKFGQGAGTNKKTKSPKSSGKKKLFEHAASHSQMHDFNVWDLNDSQDI